MFAEPRQEDMHAAEADVLCIVARIAAKKHDDSKILLPCRFSAYV